MEENKSELIDIKATLREFAAKWKWFVTSIVCCLCLGFLYSFTIKSKYEVRANVILNESNQLSSTTGGLGSVAAMFGDNASAEDEVEILTSHSVLKDVVHTLGLNIRHFDRPAPLMSTMLYTKYPVEVVPSPEFLIDTLRRPLEFRVIIGKDGLSDICVKTRGKTVYEESDKTLPYVVDIPYGKFTVETTPYYIKGKRTKNQIILSNSDMAAESLRKEVDVALATKRSSIINMQMVTDNEQYACDVLNTMIEKYNTRGLRERISQTGLTADMLKDRLLMLRQKLDSTETSLAKFKTSEGITKLDKDGTMIYQRMIETENALAEQQMLTQLARVTLAQVKNSAHNNSLIPQQSTDPILAAQIDAYNNALMSRLRMEQSAKVDNPSLLRVDEQIKTLRANLISTLESAVSTGEQMTSEYRRVYNLAVGQVNGIPKQEYAYRSKIRDQTIQEEIYLFLLRKQEEMALLINNIQPKAFVVDEAYLLNEDKSLSRKVILALSFFMGICIPLIVIVTKKMIGKQ